jgi:hypothetical protein
MAKRKGPNMHGVIKEINKLITRTKRRKTLAPHHRKLKKLLLVARGICDGDSGLYLAPED